jgi:hypothetical protein
MPVEDDHHARTGELGQYVPVVYAGSVDEADWYRQLLEDHDIAAVVDDEYTAEPPEDVKGPPTGTAVLVPEAVLEEAKEVVTEVDDMEGLEAFGEDADDVGDDEDEEYGLSYRIEEEDDGAIEDGGDEAP